MAFWDAETGIAVSDPVEGRFLVIRTTDGGASWKETARTGMPPAIEGEAAFAASGTCITVQGKDRAWIGTGGGAARVFRTTDRGETWSVSPTPIFRDSSSSGIFSVAFRDQKRGIIVGGDYRKENEARNNVALTTDGGITWSLPAGPGPRGFRSAVSYAAGGSSIIAVGPSGSDYSVDGGRSWRSLGNDGFHALSLAAGRGWAVGEAGRIARFSGDVKQR
jgi:photosystem II stability/assembly factor-like uncharacterized protein